MYTKNNGSGENNVIQNRFTAYLLTAIHRKKATYLSIPREIAHLNRSN